MGLDSDMGFSARRGEFCASMACDLPRNGWRKCAARSKIRPDARQPSGVHFNRPAPSLRPASFRPAKPSGTQVAPVTSGGYPNNIIIIKATSGGCPNCEPVVSGGARSPALHTPRAQNPDHSARIVPPCADRFCAEQARRRKIDTPCSMGRPGSGEPLYAARCAPARPTRVGAASGGPCALSREE